MIVDNAKEFHDKNFKHNYSHYSGWSKRLPLSFTSDFVQRKGSGIYFHPYIPFQSMKCDYNQDDNSEILELLKNDQRRLKYGVIQKDDAI